MPDVMQSPRTTAVPPKGLSNFAGKRVHLIGIGGSGMSALGSLLLDCGAIVSGSDQTPSRHLDNLMRRGAKISFSHDAQNLPDGDAIVVHSSAIMEDNPEIVAARAKGFDVLKFAQMLGRLMDSSVGVAISGTHGKSTTTGMVSWCLRSAGFDPSYLVGACVPQLGGGGFAGKGRHFVVEACEFDRSFLNYHPHVGAILNIDEDHLDCYRDLDDIVSAFSAFAGNVPTDGVVVINGDDPDALKAAIAVKAPVETFGLQSEKSFWSGTNVSVSEGRHSLDVLRDGQPIARMNVSLPGLHNACNALGAFAVLCHCGLEPREIARHIESFAGVDRRLMKKAHIAGVTVVDDYAHHPAEIRASLLALREFYQPERLICVFQPHQHSRTRFLLKEFACALSTCDKVLLPDIYFVRDSESERDYISSEDLAAQVRLQGGSAKYLGSFENVQTHLNSRLRRGDLLVTMGAGNVWEIADETVRWLGINR